MVNLLLWWLHKATQLSKAAIKEKQLATHFLSSCHTPSVHAALHQLQITAANSFQNSSSPFSHVPLLVSMAERLLCYCSTACRLIWHDRNQFIIGVPFLYFNCPGRSYISAPRKGVNSVSGNMIHHELQVGQPHLRGFHWGTDSGLGSLWEESGNSLLEEHAEIQGSVIFQGAGFKWPIRKRNFSPIVIYFMFRNQECTFNRL